MLRAPAQERAFHLHRAADPFSKSELGKQSSSPVRCDPAFPARRPRAAYVTLDPGATARLVPDGAAVRIQIDAPQTRTVEWSVRCE